MPKMKTKRAAAKRLKRSASGKLQRRAGWKRHKLESKSPEAEAPPRAFPSRSRRGSAAVTRLVPYL